MAMVEFTDEDLKLDLDGEEGKGETFFGSLPGAFLYPLRRGGWAMLFRPWCLSI